MAVTSWWLITQTDAPEPLLPDDGGADPFWFVLLAAAILIAALVWWAARSLRNLRRVAEQASADVAELRSELERSAG